MGVVEGGVHVGEAGHLERRDEGTDRRLKHAGRRSVGRAGREHESLHVDGCELGGGAAVPISGDASKVDGYGAGSMAAATRANAAAESTSSLGELLRRAAVCQLDPQARARPHSR